MIYQEINLSSFHDAFHCMGRKDDFTYEAREALFNYYDELDQDFELDVISICCDWSELTGEEIAKEYNIEIEEVESYLNENTFCVKLPETYLFQSF